MKDRIKRYALPLLSAAMISAFLPSCSKAESPEPAETSAPTEQVTTEAAETTAPEEEKPEETTTAAKKEKKSEKTTTTKKTSKKKKKNNKNKKSDTTATEPEEDYETQISEPVEYSENAIENYVDRESGFFSERSTELLGMEKEKILDTISFNEDYMVMNEDEKEGTEHWDYVVDTREKFAFSMDFKDGKLEKFECISKMKDFNTALSFAKTKGWKRDDSQTAKGKRVYNVTGTDKIYLILKNRNEEDGSAYVTQSYLLGG